MRTMVRAVVRIVVRTVVRAPYVVNVILIGQAGRASAKENRRPRQRNAKRKR